MGQKKTLCLVAGCSGGHILPAIQIGKMWHKDNPDGKILFFCSSKKLDKKIVAQNDFLHKIVSLNLDNFPGKKLWMYPNFFIQLFFTSLKSLYYLLKYRPHKVISTGGYIAVPVCLIAKLIKSKIELYELNVVPGKAVKTLIPIVDKIFITFEGSKLFLRNRVKNFTKRCVLQDYPVRFNDQDRVFDRQAVVEKMNTQIGQPFFSSDRKTIFLLGGSQGSFSLNNIFKNWISRNGDLTDKIQVIHQVGDADKTNWHSFYRKLNIPAIIFRYYEDIKDYYLVSDLVISRAGSGTLFELEFFKKRSLVIPLKSAYTDHQVDNALEMSNKNPRLFSVQDQDVIDKDFSVFEKDISEILGL